MIKVQNEHKPANLSESEYHPCSSFPAMLLTPLNINGDLNRFIVSAKSTTKLLTMRDFTLALASLPLSKHLLTISEHPYILAPKYNAVLAQ